MSVLTWEPNEVKRFQTEELLFIDDDTCVDVIVEVDYEENFEILQYLFGSQTDFWEQDEWPEATPQQREALMANLREWVDNKVDSLR